MRKQGFDGTKVLNLYDNVTGVFNEIFDARLLTVSFFALMGYCTLFTQRKFPMRWMVFVLFGMILLGFVTLTARIPGKARVRFHPGIAGLWLAAHGMMVVSGLFYQDWLPESVPLLLCYPVVFSVLSSREDESTFRSILRGVVFAVMPFIVWSYVSTPLVIGYPGYQGVFYDANCLSMCCTVMTTAALILTYASHVNGQKKATLGYGACALIGAVTLALTLSRSGLLAMVGVAVILALALIAGMSKHPVRLLVLVGILVVVVGAAGVKITMDKVYEAAMEDYQAAVIYGAEHNIPVTIPHPDEKPLDMDDLTSDRWGIWMAILDNLTWNGHESSVVREWVAQDGAGDRLFNAHNAFFGVVYNNGWVAGLLMIAYTLLAGVRAIRYYWIHRKTSPYAVTPLAFCAVFVLVGMFESVYAPFSVVGCSYLLVQAPLWRADLTRSTAEKI